MTPLPLWRLYLLRAAYLFIGGGLLLYVVPGFLHRVPSWELMHGVVQCLLAAICLLALLGLRYPVQMLPVLLFEMVWKSIWLLAVARPLWLEHRLAPDVMATAFACLLGMICPIVIPWRYVFANYVTRPGERWR